MADVLPPHNEEAERVTIGSLMIDPSMLEEVGAFLKPADFYLHKNAECYSAIQECGVDADVFTVSEKLERAGVTDVDSVYITQCMAEVPSAMNVASYARIVKDRAMRRALLIALGNVAKHAYDTAKPIEQVLELAAQSVDLDQDRMASVPKWSDILAESYEWFNRVLAGEEKPMADFGIAAIDGPFGGIVRGDINVISGDSGAGKTAVLTHALHNWIGTGQKPRLLIVSQEMNPAKELLPRVMAAHNKMNLSRESMQKNVEYLTARAPQYLDTLNKLSEIPTMVLDEPGVNVNQIGYWARKHEADVILVDYLQLMDFQPESVREREDQAIRRVMNRFKKIAKPTATNRGCCVVLLSQINRSASEGLGNLLGGQAIGNVAVNIAEIQNNGEARRCLAYQAEGDISTNVFAVDVDVHIKKARFGAKGKQQMLFVGAHQRFVSKEQKQ